MNNSNYRNWFGVEHIEDVIEQETGCSLVDSEKIENLRKDDVEDNCLILMNAIGFLSDFYENDSEDDDETLEDRRPVIKETIKKLCQWYQLENATLNKIERLKFNGSNISDCKSLIRKGVL